MPKKTTVSTITPSATKTDEFRISQPKGYFLPNDEVRSLLSCPFLANTARNARERKGRDAEIHHVPVERK
jgi:hypothetical protein